ncbi:uncharacterized protein BO95DRAFT_431782 [Aspergillus brunneoviolaceus CBS 621.78]|uniref:Uncharacterized protein n=1 Tax=Aspergillus brunneoviolaceus CBS 621.78 TaxID=1450534 RepID=A0ACD1G952_9EURO|nr:hypothetical protein BO95DRAFT_431782 [Aspergillus brunneoviolaceus CBS 621.78]RAH45809.1 hypothetical protein BO95DRAFT_431782 [Aspergillus brunneoviolaceus CBS 621.78]
MCPNPVCSRAGSTGGEWWCEKCFARVRRAARRPDRVLDADKECLSCGGKTRDWHKREDGWLCHNCWKKEGPNDEEIRKSRRRATPRTDCWHCGNDKSVAWSFKFWQWLCQKCKNRGKDGPEWLPLLQRQVAGLEFPCDNCQRIKSRGWTISEVKTGLYRLLCHKCKWQKICVEDEVTYQAYAWRSGYPPTGREPPMTEQLVAYMRQKGIDNSAEAIKKLEEPA